MVKIDPKNLTNSNMFYLISGYYADPEMQCQGYHVCLTPTGSPTDRKTSFLCPNGTIFSQGLFTCDWWYVKCCNLVYTDITHWARAIKCYLIFLRKSLTSDIEDDISNLKKAILILKMKKC